jgi:hypothetical protein
MMRANVTRDYRISACAVLSLALLASAVIAQATDPNMGIWKVNAAKSTYDPGPARKSGTAKWEAVGSGTKVTVDDVLADGTARHWESTVNYDGKDYPVTGTSPYGDTVARTRIDARTLQTVYKKGGTVTVTQTSVVTPDGKTRTVTTSGVDAAGQKVNNIVVYEKQ